MVRIGYIEITHCATKPCSSHYESPRIVLVSAGSLPEEFGECILGGGGAGGGGG